MIRNWAFSVVSVYNTGRSLWVRTEGNFLDREVMAEVGSESWDGFGHGEVGTNWYKIQIHRQYKQRLRGRDGGTSELSQCRELWMTGQGKSDLEPTLALFAPNRPINWEMRFWDKEQRL